MRRNVEPELLDHLDFHDPKAKRSRKDLRMINALMGNHRWIEKQLREVSFSQGGIVEIGAGDAGLALKLTKYAPVQAVDLMPAPQQLGDSLIWHSGDLFDLLPRLEGDVLVANLFLHHFEREQLETIAALAESFDTLVFCEPWRSRIGHMLGGFLWPFINSVTRHDMHVSITAGFQKGELASIFGSSWQWKEEIHPFGALHSIAKRR